MFIEEGGCMKPISGSLTIRKLEKLFELHCLKASKAVCSVSVDKF